MAILVTGVAGFIGMHVAQALLTRGERVVGIDNLNDYYPVALKEARLQQLRLSPNFEFIRLDLTAQDALQALFAKVRPSEVIHLAAQAGVRYSISNPEAYVGSNLVGFAHMLECCRSTNVAHLLYASSSSVYGGNEKLPFSESDSVDHPVSLYAATKKSNELMAHAYSHLYGFATTGLRFFTVYGPWGRPDMAPWLFTEAIESGQAIKVFNNGQLQRDFTYIDDIVQGMLGVLDHARQHGVVEKYRIFNIGNNQPVALMTFIATLEQLLGKTATKTLLPMQAGDVHATYADISRLQELVDFKPSTQLTDGLAAWVAWYRNYQRTFA